MKLIYTLVLLTSLLYTNAQTTLRLNSNIVLPKDSIESKALITSLNNFLISARKSNQENKFVFESEKIETLILLDELNGIERSEKFQDIFFYKPYLTNAVLLNDSSYNVKVSYIGINDNEALLRANFEFIAHKTRNSFTFSSPLLLNTRNWKTKKTGNNIFHYQNTINLKKVNEFNELTSIYDEKLKSINKRVDYYCCENIIELQKLIGVEYKLDYNGRTQGIWSSKLENRKLVILGNDNANFNEFDPHDLWHDRLSLVIPRKEVNRAIDEGCAYLFGGSWGLTWKEIFDAFNEQIASEENTNWIEIKETPIYFKTSGFSNSADYIINALLVQKIEKEQGFSGVWEFLRVGPSEKGNIRYYEILKKLTGISKATYNKEVWKLIRKEIR